MPEYMDYNSSSDFKTRKQKIRSNIALLLSVLFILSVVVWIIVRSPDNVRSHFETTSSKFYTLNENKYGENEYLKLLKELEKGELLVDKNFEEKFTNVYKQINLGKSDISKDKVNLFEGENSFVLTKTFVISRDTDTNGNFLDDEYEKVMGVVGLDVLIIKHNSSNGILEINAPIRYTLKFNTRYNIGRKFVALGDFEQDRFRLNFYNLNLIFQSQKQFGELDFRMNFKEIISKEQAQKGRLPKKLSISAQQIERTLVAGNKFADKFLELNYRFENTSQSKLRIEFDDEMYRMFDSVKFSGLGSKTKYKIVLNEKE